MRAWLGTAINPPSISMFNDYKKGAQLAIDIPEPTPAVTVSGIGAFATASPSNLSIQPTLTSSVLASSSSVPAVVASSSTSSLLNMPTTSPTPHRTINQGAIIGAAVAGGLVVAILLGLIGCCIYKRRLRKSNRESDFFRYRVGPYSRPAEVSASSTPMESSTQVLTEGNKITRAPSIALYSAVPRSNSPPIGPSNATNTMSAVGHQNIRRNKSYELQSHSISRSQPHVPDIRIAYTETDSSKGDSRLQRQISLDQSTIRAQRVDRHNIPQSQLRPNRPAESAANSVPEHDAGRLDVEFIAREVAARLLNTFPSHLDYSAPAIDQSPPIMDPVLSPLRRQNHTASYSVDSLVGISNVPAPPPQYHPN
ncbi:hypothetical protein AMATHDRAFT_5044 [Amanita thiersii Skay4041]|uniref:Mid2 domain-containing protein n=1 Tax=Amanita thiersii Skay4041 TaxID=703135 RepID=A0A2A9NF95_9AGAR|nr:hypothetical protein AMATHDRAFT_5044 [Amanita thiersii Skay4041]